MALKDLISKKKSEPIITGSKDITSKEDRVEMYSHVLGETIVIKSTSNGLSDKIVYTPDELQLLKESSVDMIKKIHIVKKIFIGSSVVGAKKLLTLTRKEVMIMSAEVKQAFSDSAMQIFGTLKIVELKKQLLEMPKKIAEQRQRVSNVNELHNLKQKKSEIENQVAFQVVQCMGENGKLKYSTDYAQRIAVANLLLDNEEYQGLLKRERELQAYQACDKIQLDFLLDRFVILREVLNLACAQMQVLCRKKEVSNERG